MPSKKPGVSFEEPRELLAMLSTKSSSIGASGGGSAHDRLTAQDVAAALVGLPDVVLDVALAVTLRDPVSVERLAEHALQTVHDLARISRWCSDGASLSDDQIDRRYRTIASCAVLALVSDARCTNCGGSGWETRSKQCGVCLGTGRGRPRITCGRCEGSGLVNRIVDEDEDDEVYEIPARVRTRIDNLTGAAVETTGRLEHEVCGTCKGQGWTMLTDKQAASAAGVDPAAWSRRWRPRVDQVVATLEARLEVAERHVRSGLRRGHPRTG